MNRFLSVLFLTVLTLIILLQTTIIPSYAKPTDSVALNTTCTLKSSGDANCDGVINETDYDMWSSSFRGVNYSPPQNENGGAQSNAVAQLFIDFNTDGKSDLIDYEIWRKNAFDAAPVAPTPTTVPASGVSDAVISELKKTFTTEQGVVNASITVSRTQPYTWPDGCIGCGTTNSVCTQALTAGYKVVLKAPVVPDNGNCLYREFHLRSAGTGACTKAGDVVEASCSERSNCPLSVRITCKNPEYSVLGCPSCTSSTTTQ